MTIQRQNGLLLIPDISGYTEFVNSVEITHSAHIISNLLETILATNELGLELHEIEGDALFFYKSGDPPSLKVMMEQINRWVDAFNVRLIELMQDLCSCGACQSIPNLSLKVVGHYGEVGIFTIGNRTKLIGKDVILAHRLLKNSLKMNQYVLFSSELLNRMVGQEPAERFQQHCENYPVFGDVSLGVLEIATPFPGALGI